MTERFSKNKQEYIMNTSQHSRDRDRDRDRYRYRYRYRYRALTFSQEKATDFDPCEIRDTAAFKTTINLIKEDCLL